MLSVLAHQTPTPLYGEVEEGAFNLAVQPPGSETNQLPLSREKINSLKTKRWLFYLKTQFVPRSKHFSSQL